MQSGRGAQQDDLPISIALFVAEAVTFAVLNGDSSARLVASLPAFIPRWCEGRHENTRTGWKARACRGEEGPRVEGRLGEAWGVARVGQGRTGKRVAGTPFWSLARVKGRDAVGMEWEWGASKPRRWLIGAENHASQ